MIYLPFLLLFSIYINVLPNCDGRERSGTSSISETQHTPTILEWFWSSWSDSVLSEEETFSISFLYMLPNRKTWWLNFVPGVGWVKNNIFLCANRCSRLEHKALEMWRHSPRRREVGMSVNITNNGSWHMIDSWLLGLFLDENKLKRNKGGRCDDASTLTEARQGEREQKPSFRGKDHSNFLMRTFSRSYLIHLD